jgi:hypothetical protein
LTDRGDVHELHLVQAVANRGPSIQDLSLAAHVRAITPAGAPLRAKADVEACPRYVARGKIGYVVAKLFLRGSQRGQARASVTLTDKPTGDDPHAVLSVRKLRLARGPRGGTRASGVAVNAGTEMVHSALVCVILHSSTRPVLSVTSFYPIGPIPAGKSIRFETDVVAPIVRERVASAEAFVVGE